MVTIYFYYDLYDNCIEYKLIVLFIFPFNSKTKGSWQKH